VDGSCVSPWTVASRLPQGKSSKRGPPWHAWMRWMHRPLRTPFANKRLSRTPEPPTCVQASHNCTLCDSIDAAKLQQQYRSSRRIGRSAPPARRSTEEAQEREAAVPCMGASSSLLLLGGWLLVSSIGRRARPTTVFPSIRHSVRSEWAPTTGGGGSIDRIGPCTTPSSRARRRFQSIMIDRSFDPSPGNTRTHIHTTPLLSQPTLPYIRPTNRQAALARSSFNP
jgi:hypothetical protein